MIARLIEWLWRLVALSGSQASESIDLGDDPYIPGRPEDIAPEPRTEADDGGPNRPVNSFPPGEGPRP